MEASQLRDLVTVYEERRSIAEELDEEAKAAKAERDKAENDLINAILAVAEETGIDDLSVTAEGRKYSVRMKDYYTIPKANRDEAYELLRELGHGDLITEKVDDRTLSKEMAEVAAAYRAENPDGAEDFPGEYEPLMAMLNRYSKPSLGRVIAR